MKRLLATCAVVLAGCGAITGIDTGHATPVEDAGPGDAGGEPTTCPGARVLMASDLSVQSATWNGTRFALKDVVSPYGIRAYDADGAATGDSTSTHYFGPLIDTADGFATTDITVGVGWRLQVYDGALHMVTASEYLDSDGTGAMLDDGARFVLFSGAVASGTAIATAQTFDRATGAVSMPTAIGPTDAPLDAPGGDVHAVRTASGFVAVYGSRALGIGEDLTLRWTRDLPISGAAVHLAALGDGFLAWSYNVDSDGALVGAFDGTGHALAAPSSIAGSHLSVAVHGTDVIAAWAEHTGGHLALHAQPLAADASPLGAPIVLRASDTGYPFVRALWAGTSFAVVYSATAGTSRTDTYLQRLCP